ncbi:hypothetical protein [Lactobacillus sp. Sy-1]|uniref:hypothetical protein n=1 Tax=Lactobacillus sp. Sy-1 TaxID=2109645 RepID=UPI001C5B0E32|nr:hypothetical protein [Lactobacillus sp. Sy-1]MBW1606211.1 hypothetical protein [Lactobacillus sp. Sy-1]
MKTKLALTLLWVPLLLAGCGNNNSNDGQFSGRSKSITTAVNRSKEAAKKQSESNSSSIQTSDYQSIDKSFIERALDKKQIAVAKAQIANKKFIIDGKIKQIGKVKSNQRSILVSSNGQNYIVYARPEIIKNVKANQSVKIYGSGLSIMSGNASDFGISQKLSADETLLFNAAQIDAK